MLMTMKNPVPARRGNQYNPQPLEEKFWAKVDKRGPDECWPWNASTDRGYGRMGIKVDGKWKTTKAHRISYEMHIGPIPEGKVLDHNCHNPKTCSGGGACPHRRCVNPRHVIPVCGDRNNSIERMAAWRPSTKTHCRRGHEYTPENTYTKTTKKGYINRICRTCQRNTDRKAAQVRAKRKSA